MKVKLTKGQVAIAAVAAVSFMLASGCSSDKGGTSDKTHSYTTTTVTTTTNESPKLSATGGTNTVLSATGGTNTVIPLYKESVVVGKRDVDGGSVRVKKIVKTETVNQPVELRHEEIVLERVPASETASSSSSSGSDSAFTGKETVIHLTKEEPVIEKQTASAGQVVLQTRSTSRQTNVQTQIRVEDVAMADNAGNVIHESEEAKGGAETPSGEASGQSMGGVITDPAMLLSNPPDMSGRTVQFSNLKVLSVTGTTVGCLDAGNGQQLYILCSKGAPSLKAGDVVNVKGIVQTGASNLSETDAQILGSQPAYIRAKTVDHASQ